MSNKDQKNTVNTVKKEEEVKTPEVKKAEPVVYVGASLPRGALQQYSVFTNGLPKTLAADIERCSAIGHLMVPVSKLAEVRAKLTVKGSLEYTLNEQVQSYVRGGK